MQYILVVASAFAAIASAQGSPSSYDPSSLVSVLSVLENALPSSILAEAITNSAAVSSEIASEFAAGQTPSWFHRLPSDVKTFLVPALATSGAVSNSANRTASSTGINGTAIITSSSSGNLSSSVIATSTGSGSTSASDSSGSTTGTASTSASSSSASSSASSSSSSAGAPMPTAIFGAGLAGALGLVGLLAL